MLDLRDFTLISTLIALILVVFVGGHAVYQCTSEKRNNFLLVVLSIVFILIGSVIEVTSANTFEAFIGIRIQYIGSSYVFPFFLFFVADYCEVKIPRLIKAIPLTISTLMMLGAWTTNKTGLLYASYYYDSVKTHYILYSPGKLNLVFKAVPLLFLLACVVILGRRILASRGQYRSNLIIILVSAFAPYFADILYTFMVIFGGGNEHALYLVPHAMAAMALLMYLGIMKYDMFDAIPMASAVAIDTIAEAFLLLDRDFSCVSHNQAAAALFPWVKDMPRGTPIFKSISWPKELSPSVFVSITHDEPYRVEYTMDSVQTGPRDFRANINYAMPRSHKSKNEMWSVLIQDITEQKSFVKRLEEQAYTDTLTGLYNRRHFAEIAAPYIERARRLNTPYYVLICDLDHFKRVNDEFGHLAGDEVLRNTASILKSTIRSYDILARWGGEEFIMLITDPDESSALGLAERVRTNIENSVCEYMGRHLKITVSCGVARNDEKTDLTELIRRADDALYDSKQTGRNKVTMWK